MAADGPIEITAVICVPSALGTRLVTTRLGSLAVSKRKSSLVPTGTSPPGIPFTLQMTFGLGVPSSVAENCRTAPTGANSIVGVTVTAPMTVNGVGELADPAGVVIVIRPVLAPAGTIVAIRFA